MPTVLRSGPFRFFFYAGDRGEPPHVHVERDDCECKFSLEPIALERNRGFPRKAINTIRRLLEWNHALLMERWHEYFRQ